MKPIFALVDCNNFYVSCERVFNPQIQNVPVAVLSSNDGCIVARSNEVKAMGVKMGAPYFKYESTLKKNKVKIFSSNYSLYADMSHRVMSTLAALSPHIEIYSIDEAFLDFTYLKDKDYTSFALKIRKQIQQWTGIPVSIGIANTKTLSKVASHIAKKSVGVFDFTKLSELEINEMLSIMPVDDIWGVGRRYDVMLRSYGIRTALDFKQAEERFIRSKMTVTGVRTLKEMNGISVIPFGYHQVAHKGIASTRSFGKEVCNLEDLRQAVARFTSIASEKLRKQKSIANFIHVFVATNKHHKFEKHYSNSIGKKLERATASTPVLTKTAIKCLEIIYDPDSKYKRAGVFIGGIQPEGQRQYDLFSNPEDNFLMRTIDKLNSKWGSGTIRLASEGLDVDWLPKQTLRSSRFTTRWEELPKVR